VSISERVPHSRSSPGRSADARELRADGAVEDDGGGTSAIRAAVRAYRG
jgi:hypothetical protein